MEPTELCGESGWSWASKEASGLWWRRAGPSSYLCFLGVDLSLSWLVEVVEEASWRVTCLFGVDLGLSWVEGVATRKVTCGSYGWSSWGLVVRRSGRGISHPKGVDAVHRSWNSAGEPSCKLAKVLSKMKLTVTLTPGFH